MNKENTLLSCEDLLLRFDHKRCFKSERLNFNYLNDKDLYNITAPFNIKEETFIAGRLEKRDSEFSEIAFFKKNGNTWDYIDNAIRLELQDPFITFVNDKMLFGGVHVKEDDDGTLIYKTVLYRGNSIYDLEYFAEGPIFMKDIRFLQLSNGKVLVFTRPQGEIGGRGTIGYIIIDRIEDFSIEKVMNAKLLENQFLLEEWGGANELHLVTDKVVGVLSHIAKFDENGNRHYYASAFTFDIESGEYSPMQIIAKRNLFDCNNYKRPDLEDVIFSGGLVRFEDGTADLYCGVSDCEAHKIRIVDPFIQIKGDE